MAKTAPGSRPMQGLVCVETGMLLFVAQDALMKALLGPYPVWSLIFARSVTAIIVLAPCIMLLGAPHRLTSPLWRIHLIRAVLLTTGFTLFYTAFPFMGLAEVTTIFFAAPLMTATLAALFLKESIGPHRIAALVAGFAGVVIAMRPGSDAFSWVALLPLACALAYAIAQILARVIGERESTLTVGLVTLGVSGPMILCMGFAFNLAFDPGAEFAHLRWDSPIKALEWPGPVAALALTGTFGWILMTRAYQVASASLIAPFDYTYLPFAAALAYFVWSEVPSQSTLIGMAMIIGSGVYLSHREFRARKTSA